MGKERPDNHEAKQQKSDDKDCGWKRCLLHVHTYPRSSDASLHPEEAIKKAVALGVRILVFTEHETSWKAEELEALRRETQTDLLLIGARELNHGDGHLIILGCEPPIFGSVKTIVEKVHGQGGAVILAHPFDVRFQIPPRMAADWGVDAVETVNLKSRNASTQDLASLSLLKMNCVAGARYDRKLCLS